MMLSLYSYIYMTIAELIWQFFQCILSVMCVLREVCIHVQGGHSMGAFI